MGVDAREQGGFLRLDPAFAYAEASFLMTFAMGGVPHAGSQHRMPEELWTGIHNIVQEAVTKTILKEKKCKQAKQLSDKALQTP